MPIPHPSRGEVWDLDLGPTAGHEQVGSRPGLVVSVDQFNRSRAELVVIVPATTSERRLPFHVRVEPPEGGVERTTFLMCEQIRAVSTRRLRAQRGRVSTRTFMMIEERLRVLLGL